MQSFTDKADELYCEAFNVEIPQEIPDCYEGLLKRQELFDQAKEMEAAAKDIREEFQLIAESGFPLPASTLLRKAIISVKKGKLMFSTEQLGRVVSFLMQHMPYILFRPTSETKDYVILVFWATSIDESACEIQRRAEIIKQEIAVDNFQLRFTTEKIPTARRFMSYMINNFVTMTVQSDEVCHLPPDEHKEFTAFQKLLKAQNILEKSNKRSCPSPEFMDCEPSI